MPKWCNFASESLKIWHHIFLQYIPSLYMTPHHISDVIFTSQTLMDWTCAQHIRHGKFVLDMQNWQKFMGAHYMKILPLICYNNKKTKQQLSKQELRTDCVALESHCNGSSNSFYNHAVIVTVFAVMSLMNIFKTAFWRL